MDLYECLEELLSQSFLKRTELVNGGNVEATLLFFFIKKINKIL